MQSPRPTPRLERIRLSVNHASINTTPARLDGLTEVPSIVVAVVYFATVVVAEIVTAMVHPLWGMIFHVAVLGALLVHASLPVLPVQRGLLLSLAMAPIIRIVSLGLPLGQFEPLWRYAIAALPLMAASGVIMQSIPLGARDIGIRLPARQSWVVTAHVALSGVVLGIVEFIILQPDPIVSKLTFQTVLLAAVILVVGTGVLEEVVFRGILQVTATKALGLWPGILFTSALFGVLHVGHLSVIDVAFVTAVGLYFAIVVHLTRTLIGVSIAHGLTNTMLFVVLPFTSGI